MERAVLVTVDLGADREWSAKERSSELRELAESTGANVVEEIIVHRKNPDPAYYIGSGKADEVRSVCARVRAKVVIFNNDLSGSQQKNLEDAVCTKTIDRTQLILDIFARHAHSNEGKLQVELAQLMYLLPRLTGKGIELSRLGGGIGTRGPGEQKLEVDRRKIRDKISRLKRELDTLRDRRAMMRKKRSRYSPVTIAIVGYTNVGKSTLLNALTDSKVIVADKLFATLDPTVRKYELPGKLKALFIDTVGFIDLLPHHLVEAFKATLEEVVQADLLLHVVDASHSKALEQAHAVYAVLSDIGARDKPIITALNKSDIVKDMSVIKNLESHFARAVHISALKKTGFDGLTDIITRYVETLVERVSLRIPISEQKTVSFLYENGSVLGKKYSNEYVDIDARIPAKMKESFTQYLRA